MQRDVDVYSLVKKEVIAHKRNRIAPYLDMNE
jgi:hypothetical protein